MAKEETPATAEPKGGENYERLKANKEKALAYANDVAGKPVVTEKTAQGKLDNLQGKITADNLTEAIRLLDEIKDNKLGIVWHINDKTTPQTLVRDARGVDPKDLEAHEAESGEKYAMQVLNEIRGAISLIDQQPEETDRQKADKDAAKAKLMFLAEEAIKNVDSLPTEIKKYNTNLIHILDTVS